METWLYRDLLVLVNSQRDVERLVPDVGKMRLLPMGKAVVITARGDAGGPDFVSRVFRAGDGDRRRSGHRLVAQYAGAFLG